MAIDPLPTAPSASNPSGFPTLADAFVVALGVFTGQVNAALGLLTSFNNSRIVDVVSNANVNLTGGIANGVVIDGVTLVTGMRVLLIAQATASQNGIYDVPVSGVASRSIDCNSAALFPSGLIITVTRGTYYKDYMFRHTTANGFTLGTTSLTFSFLVPTLQLQGSTKINEKALQSTGVAANYYSWAVSLDSFRQNFKLTVDTSAENASGGYCSEYSEWIINWGNFGGSYHTPVCTRIVQQQNSLNAGSGAVAISVNGAIVSNVLTLSITATLTGTPTPPVQAHVNTKLEAFGPNRNLLINVL